MLNNYLSMCAFLCEADAATLEAVTFEDVCRRFHTDPVKADRAFYSVFGMSGDEIIRHFLLLL